MKVDTVPATDTTTKHSSSSSSGSGSSSSSGNNNTSGNMRRLVSHHNAQPNAHFYGQNNPGRQLGANHSVNKPFGYSGYKYTL